MRLVLAAVLFIGWQLQGMGQDGPPPPQNFGPDTYRIGLSTGQGTTKPGLSCDGSTSRGRVCTGFLASAVDGALLDVTVTVPPGNGPHPLVTVMHGWGGSKTSLGYIADPLLKDGNAVLRYSARGFGRSWGQVNLADVNVEMEDLRSIIGQVVDQGRLHLDRDAVGIVGVSYGGGQSWLSLVQPSFLSPEVATVRIRAVVPIVPWTDLLYSLLPNGRPERSLAPAGSAKLSYINGLYFSGLRASPPNYPDYLVAWHAWINGMEPNRVDPLYQQIVDGVAGYRSIWWQEQFWRDAAANRVPVFQIQGLTDDLFPLPEAKRMLLALKTIDPLYPIASYFGDLGHPRASNKPEERDYVVGRSDQDVGSIRAWFAYYLRSVGTEPAHNVRAAITRPRNESFDPANVITVDIYGALSTTTIPWDFPDDSKELVNPGGEPSGFFWDPLVMEAARELEPYPDPGPPDAPLVVGSAVFTVEVAKLIEVAKLPAHEPLLIAGQPTVSLRALTPPPAVPSPPAVPAPRVQLNVRLIDVAPDGTENLITRGTFMLEPPVPRAPTDVVIPTYGNVWKAAPDHVLRLEITNVDSPYLAPSRVPSTTEISQVRLQLPVR
jgi:pimeloyl-ACP methyl ester carboxylesterase